MKSLKMSIAIILTLVMAVGLLAGCSQKKKKEEVEIFSNIALLSLSCVSNPEFTSANQFIDAAWEKFAAQYDKYDVKLRNGKTGVFQQTEFKEAIVDCYGTKDCPDITFGGYFTLSGYMYDGYVVPLDDIITDNMKNDISESSWEMSRGNNGKTYMLPFYALQNIISYNKEMFRACGLDKYIADEEVIQGWSLDEWEDIFSTLAQKLPKYHYPMMMYAKNEQGDTHIMAMLRCKGSDFFDEEGLFNLNTPEGIAGLQWFKDNYDKGYYPPQCEDLDIAENSEMFYNDQIAFFIWNSAFTEQSASRDIGYVNYPGVESHGVNTNWLEGFMVFDNGDPKKIEVCKDFLSFIYGNEETLDYETSGEPCSKSVATKWADQLPLHGKLSANDQYAINFTANNPNWPAVRQAFWPHIHALLAGDETAEQAAEGIDRDCNEAITSVTRTLHE